MEWNNKAQFDMSELNPFSIIAGVICALVVFTMMGNTGTVKVGLIWRIGGLVLGAVGGYLIFDTILNR